jgi:Ca-activated chloride channel family protein
MEGGPNLPSSSIGLATGGAKDINNFRENIANGYLPLPSDVTYEGLFYDYYFDTGAQNPCDKLFCPAYSCAVTRDPFSEKEEYYLAVGLNSGMKQSDFERKKLNLVIVLDKSGSMNNPFDTYYYDQAGNPIYYADEEDYSKDKFEIATEAITALLRHLEYDDNLALVLFNSGARVELPMSRVGDLNMGSLERHVLNLTAGGSTNLSAGMEQATDILEDYARANPAQYENRIIFLTDAMPNTGDTDDRALFSMMEANAADGIFTSFIGIGVDFNSDLVERITKTKGANYYSVHSSREFMRRMDDEFDYMVTPLVFDLNLRLEASGWDIEKVYGSPQADEATGELMSVSTLFPSERRDGEARGGIILVKLRRSFWGWGDSIKLKVTYEDRNGWRDGSEAYIELPDGENEYFANDGIRKAVLLTRYAALLKNWLIDEREHIHLSHPWEPRVDDEDGIIVPPELGTWERQSLPLTVSRPYEDLFRYFGDYFADEMAAVGDYSLDQELDVLDTLCRY